MPANNFIMTIDSDSEDSRKRPKSTTEDEDDPHLNPEFAFDFTDDPLTDALHEHNVLPDLVKTGSKLEPISVDDIIARRKLAFNRKRDADEMEGGESGGRPETSVVTDTEFGEHRGDVEEEEEEEDPLATSDEGGNDLQPEDSEPIDEDDDPPDGNSSPTEDSEDETQAEKDRKAAFFDATTSLSDIHTSFLTMNLSRPILKALASLGFHKPTPIQAAAIPVALLGKDIVGGAVTGSGKTAAFIVPMVERLLFRERGKKAAAVRCLILVPTRELAVQCFETGRKLASLTDIRFCLIVGGLSVKSQEVTLRSRPDIIIATPGRLIDHLRNSPSFTLDTLDVLVLDEADRMLSDGFADELSEIVKSCPKGRQTMLFSATMTDSVDELVRMSLNKPVRLFVDPKRRTARGLVQEFVRIRAGKEAERSALLVTLCKRSFKTGVIIFFRSKKLAHQMRIVFSLLGMKCDELHGNLTQEQRLKALQQFRDGRSDYLMATDLASRGLDIKGVETVINYDMPSQLDQYLHRVGRTARAGMNGRSVTLVGEADRKMLKAAIKHGAGQDHVRHRMVPPEAVSKWVRMLEGITEEVAAVLREEEEEKHLQQAELELKKGENMIEHEAEIYSRPARTWFQSANAKRKAEAVSKKQYEESKPASRYNQVTVTGDTKPQRDGSRKAKRRKLAKEYDEQMNDRLVLNAAIRSAKRAARPSKIGLPEQRPPQPKPRGKRKAGKMGIKAHAGSAFDRDLGQKYGKNEGLRGTTRGKGGVGERKRKR